MDLHSQVTQEEDEAPEAADAPEAEADGIVCARARVCVCVDVCERETESERERVCVCLSRQCVLMHVHRLVCGQINTLFSNQELCTLVFNYMQNDAAI